MDTFADLPLHIAQYLHTRGLVNNPDDPLTGNNPPVFINGWDGEPDTAVNLEGIWATHPDPLGAVCSPRVNLIAAVRAPDQGTLWRFADRIVDALEIHERVELTAEMQVVYCSQVIIDSPQRDVNGRWVRVHTLTMHPHRN